MGRSIFNRLKDPLIGTLIQQRYQIVERIGSGSVVDVYLAKQRVLGARRVALRVLKPALAEQESKGGGIHGQRFFHEVRLSSLLKGPAFARVFDGGMLNTTPKRPFVVQELLEGPLLSALVAESTPSWREGAALILQLCAATEEMHAYGILYRDFSPSNVIIEEQRGVGRVARLFDFSHATVEGVSLGESDSASEDLAGSPVFSAPELGNPGEITNRTADTFSLGALLYLACTGRPPVRLPGPSDWPGWRSWVEGGHPVPEVPFKSLVKRAPAALDRVVTKALSVSPKARYQDVSDLNADLRSVLGIKCDQEGKMGGFSLASLLGKLK